MSAMLSPDYLGVDVALPVRRVRTGIARNEDQVGNHLRDGCAVAHLACSHMSDGFSNFCLVSHQVMLFTPYCRDVIALVVKSALVAGSSSQTLVNG
jgi:hypothetical protein